MRFCLQVFFFVYLVSISVAQAQNYPSNPRDGQVFSEGDQPAVAWDSVSKRWLSLEDFWRSFAERRSGITWGQSRDYPPYARVSEQDLFMVELDSGLCLMEFWHGRWRRANDVRRWDDAFNRYGGCSDVFK